MAAEANQMASALERELFWVGGCIYIHMKLGALS